jgi:hypothetical protein
MTRAGVDGSSSNVRPARSRMVFMESQGPLRALHDERPAPPGADSPEPRAPADQAALAPERAIVCAACGHPVTSSRQRIEVQGAHAHRFMNPAGFLYRVGCFADAVGCAIVGPPSGEYPWFPGHEWRLATCGGCGVQLGWHFRGETSAFFGLILDRLREDEAGGADA